MSAQFSKKVHAQHMPCSDGDVLVQRPNTNGGRSVKQKLVSDIRQLVCSIWSRVVIPRTVLKNGKPSKAELRVNQVQHALSGKATIQTTNSFYSHYFVILKRFFFYINLVYTCLIIMSLPVCTYYVFYAQIRRSLALDHVYASCAARNVHVMQKEVT